ncbi:MAG: dihydropteroate synthase [Terriglobales bacterium]
MRQRFEWDIGTRKLTLGKRTLVMGVLNVTPDSFSDGGRYFDASAAAEHALRMIEEGADIVDVGGESTRPGARTAASPEPQAERPTGVVSAEEEMRRVIPVIGAIKRMRPETVISIDTYKLAVARAAVAAGAEIVNDVSGFTWEPAMATTVAELGCGAVVMHTRGRPDEWRTLPAVDDMAGLVMRELGGLAEGAMKAGVRRERIMLDPGFGFGKRMEENYPLLARFDEFQKLGFPLLAGPSRKSFIGKAMARGGEAPAPADRVSGSVAAAVICIVKGAHMVRAHDVKEMVGAAKVADVI